MATTIVNMLKRGELAQSLVFSGSRGTGKTTTARIVARALNCEKIDKTTYNPCCECQTCQDILHERSFTYQEMDAASNGLVDDVRRIKEEVRYVNATNGVRVYCIDECHSLTDKAWQAFLKMLEEPPPNTVFIFCTTEAHKIPETILSRSMDFTFMRMTHKHIVDRLTYVCDRETIKVDQGVLMDIARHVNGGMRDAVSLLDQLRAYGSGQLITSAHVAMVIGAVNVDLLFKLFDACFTVNTTEVYRLLQHAYTEVSDIGSLVQNLIEFYREMLLVKVGVHLPDVQVNYANRLKEYGAKVGLDYIIQCQSALADIHDSLRRTQLPGRSVLDISIPNLFFGGVPRVGAHTQLITPIASQTSEPPKQVLAPDAIASMLGATVLAL
jgi:DNA polymerase-3 subunit gamma/tau